MTATDRLLAVRLPNWVGDVCMALPALALLHERGHILHCFGRRWAGDLLAGLPYRVEILPKRGKEITAAIRASGARQGVLFTNSFSSAWQMRRAGIRPVGYARDFRGFLLGHAPARRRGVHEVESFWDLAVAVGGVPGGGTAGAPRVPDRLQLPLAERHRAEAAAALATAGVAGPYTVLCPLAVGTIAGRPKQWPSFALLCRGLIEQGDAIVACPGPGEEAATLAVLPGARLLPGLGLGAYAAVLAGARRVVANDSGPMHLAAAVGAPVLGIFGLTEPARTRPWSPRAATVGDVGTWPSVQAVWESLGRLPAGG
jgi:heptosyltransferase-2